MLTFDNERKLLSFSKVSFSLLLKVICLEEPLYKPINYLAPLGKSEHANLQANFAVSKFPTDTISRPKWRYNKADVQGRLSCYHSQS